MSHSVKLIVAIGAAAILAAGSWHLLTQLDSSATDEYEAARRSPFAALSRSYGILREHTVSSPPRIEASVQRALDHRGQTFRLESSHLAHTPRGDLWVIAGVTAGRSGSCLIWARSGAISCTSAAEVIRNGMALGVVEPASDPSRAPRGFLILGIAPDWAQAARLQVGVGKNARFRLVAVRHNAYAFRSQAPSLVEGLCTKAFGRCKPLHPAK
jgi:hypothetical protein